MQNALTAIVPIKPAELPALRTILTAIGDDIEDNPHISWEESPSTHFARLVILDSGSENIPSLKGYPPRLLFTSNHDGSFEDYMKELVNTFGADLEKIFSACEGFPSGDGTNVARFTKFISDHSHPSNTFYIACRGVTVKTMHQSIRIREALNKLLDSRDARQRLGDLISQLPPAPPPVVPSESSTGKQSALASFLEWLVGIRPGRNPNKPVDSPQNQLRIEDRVTQNQMTVIVPIRRNPKSWLLIRLILWAVNKVGAASTGSLSGLTTIHFARWAIIDNGKNLFFESNFDGSWENYIDDFVDRASLGMNAIWGNCVGFPRGGCKDIEWFKKYIRDNQIPAQMFYSAYPQSSIKNNLNDLQVASAVRRFFREDEIALFLNGSYNLGVTKALSIPLPSDVNGSAPPAGKIRGGLKKPGLCLLLLAAGGLYLWSKRNRQS